MRGWDMLKYLIPMVFLLSLPIMAMAATTQTCVSPSILQINDTVEITSGGTVTPVVAVWNTTCPHGCEETRNGTDACIQLSEGSMSLPLVWMGGTALFALFAIFLRNKDLVPLQIFFFFISIYFFLNTVNIALNMARMSSFGSASLLSIVDTGIMVLTWTNFAVFAIYFAFFIIKLVKWVGGMNTKKRKGRYD